MNTKEYKNGDEFYVIDFCNINKVYFIGESLTSQDFYLYSDYYNQRIFKFHKNKKGELE